MKYIEEKRVSDITPFDSESKEDIKNMKFDINIKKEVKIVSDKVGKGRLVK